MSDLVEKLRKTYKNGSFSQFSDEDYQMLIDTADEIERLKERLEKAEEFGRGNQARAVKAEARVEELENSLIAKTADHETCATAMFEAEARVEELDRLREAGVTTQIQLLKTIDELKQGHHITDDQIDAAVYLIQGHPANHVTWLAFNKLGIDRCEGCWSCMGPAGLMDPDCNGHKWVKGE